MLDSFSTSDTQRTDVEASNMVASSQSENRSVSTERSILEYGKEVLPTLDDIDRELILLTQKGLPLAPRPYHLLGLMLGIPGEEVMQRLKNMLASGKIRRIAAVPNHYVLGYRANGMTVWDVPDDQVQTLGRMVGALPFVSHCYHRPRHLPLWSYNLFAMVHGKKKQEVKRHISEILNLLGSHCRAHDVLYSTRILKKTGLRIRAEDDKNTGNTQTAVAQTTDTQTASTNK